MEMMNGGQNFNRTQQEEPRVGRRFSPIKMLMITATTAGTAQTLITAPDKRSIEIKNLMISNITAVDVVFSLYAVPSGGAVDNTTVLCKNWVIKAEAGDDLSKYIALLHEPGTSLMSFCGTASAVKFKGMVEEVF